MKRTPPHYTGNKHPNYNPNLHIVESAKCLCGCGNDVIFPKSRPKKFISGHNSRVKHPMYNKDLHILDTRKCECGCGKVIEFPRSRPKRFVSGHNINVAPLRYNNDLHIIEKSLCKCGCGTEISFPKSRPRRFVTGHFTRTRPIEEQRRYIRCALNERKKYFENKVPLAPLYKRIKTSLKYKEWRTAVFNRDKFICVECKCSGYIQAHHIVPFSVIYKKSIDHRKSNDEIFKDCMNNEELFDVSNGKTLCIECHKKQEVHSIIKRKKP